MRWSSPPRERRGGTAPRHSPGGSFLCPNFSEIATRATRPRSLASVLPVAKQPRHVFEDFPLVARQTVDPLLRDLVEYAIELFGFRFTSAWRRRERRDALRRDGFALRDDII